MFSSLSGNLTKIFDKLRRKGVLTEDDINETMRAIRIALLEADVSLAAISELIKNVKAKAIGTELMKSISPGQLIVKIVNDELTHLLGSENQEINLQAVPPVVIMMVGLQGSGKTTSSAKLGLLLRKKYKKNILMASLDVYRPAAQQQLEVLGKQVEISTLPIIAHEKPLEIAARALNSAKANYCDVLILDTAGRLHTDEQLIDELKQVKKLTNPTEILLVVDSLTGQDAVNIGKEFNEKVGITGSILTRIDGDARGGAALSMRVVTNVPIKYIGVGEKINEFEAFHPERAASRILDMGDIVSFVEKAAENISMDEVETLSKRVQSGKFDLNDLLSQLKSMKKMGSIASMLSMIPGVGKLKKQLGNVNLDEVNFKSQEAIISSMTLKERKNPKIINASRKIRIANGSGTKVSDVNRLLKQFMDMSSMMKKFGGMDPKKMKQMSRMFNG